MKMTTTTKEEPFLESDLQPNDNIPLAFAYYMNGTNFRMSAEKR